MEVVNNDLMVIVAQLVRAPGCGPGGRGFKSPHSPHIKALSGFGKGFKFIERNILHLYNRLTLSPKIKFQF